jgi:hypothetical protein
MSSATHEPDPRDDELIARLRTLHDQEPPASLLPQIMDRIGPRRPTCWRRLWMRMTRPATITFRPMPWAAGGVAALLVASILVTRLGSPRMPVAPMGTDASPVTVTFALQAPDARSVQLIGSFNHWHPGTQHALVPDQRTAGLWVVQVTLEPGRHEYAFLVDGARIVSDPRASFSQVDGFGTRNSVIFADGLDGSRL